jgi:hypothetical protein
MGMNAYFAPSTLTWWVRLRNQLVDALLKPVASGIDWKENLTLNYNIDILLPTKNCQPEVSSRSQAQITKPMHTAPRLEIYTSTMVTPGTVFHQIILISLVSQNGLDEQTRVYTWKPWPEWIKSKNYIRIETCIIFGVTK